MLYKLHSNILITGLLTIGFLTVLMPDRAFCMMTLVTIFSFVTQVLLIMNYSRMSKVSCTSLELFVIVLLYSIFLGTIFMLVSYYYDGDTFVFSKSDALLYYDTGLRAIEKGYIENARYIINKYEYEEWGGLLSISFIMSILPFKIFLNAIYMSLGAISSVMIFRIGKHFMPNTYAFCGALAYGTSSYMVFFYCACLKETIFVFFVISAMYFFYRSILDGSRWALLGTLICLAAIVFFRPAVTVFLVMSFIAYYVIKQRGKAVSIFLFLIVAIGIVSSFAFMQGLLDSYTLGDQEQLVQNRGHDSYTGTFNFYVACFAAVFGPFPTLFPTVSVTPSLTNFYGAGLIYRLFVIITFWIGIFFAVKNRNIDFIPLVLFVLVEMSATAYLTASLELRKVLPHMPFMYILMFYGLHQCKTDTIHPVVKRVLPPVAAILAIGILMVWTVFRVKISY